MSEQSSTPITGDPIGTLTTLVEELDPLYRPAEFLLGYTYLRRGDAKNAKAIFGRLVERFKDEQLRRIDVLGAEWLATAKWRQWIADHLQTVDKLLNWVAKAWVRLGRRIPVVDRWVEIYLDLLSFLHGGRYVIDAHSWDDLKSALGDASKSSDAHIDRLVTLLKGPFGNRAAIVAGRASSQTISPHEARHQLDRDLDRHQIWMFDSKLESLYLRCLTYPNPGQAAPLLTALLDYRIGKYLWPMLETLKAHIAAENWSEALKDIRELRRYTRDPSPWEFARILDNADTEEWEMLLVILFMPVFKRVRRLRQEFRVPLYMESVLYLAQSFLMTFERDGLDKAYEQARALRVERLAPSLPGQERDVYLLAICLEVEAVVRWEEMEPASDEETVGFPTVSIGIALLPSGWRTQVTSAADDKINTREVRAAAYVACGMLERRQRRLLTQMIKTESRQAYRQRADLALYHELEQYYLALELRPSATIHAYIAEALLVRGRIDDARSHVRQALLMAPDHVLAKRLEGSISGSQLIPQ